MFGCHNLVSHLTHGGCTHTHRGSYNNHVTVKWSPYLDVIFCRYSDKEYKYSTLPVTFIRSDSHCEWAEVIGVIKYHTACLRGHLTQLTSLCEGVCGVRVCVMWECDLPAVSSCDLNETLRWTLTPDPEDCLLVDACSANFLRIVNMVSQCTYTLSQLTHTHITAHTHSHYHSSHTITTHTLHS